tara:strand:- start:686 stop:2230 length:1545 start_codon:yes stop_codon:yes gene_type:complete
MAYALLSVSDKTEITTLARALVEQGYELISSGGTARHLESEGVAVTSVEQITGFPECLDGRVKTLHPRIHGGILHRRDVQAHCDTVESLEMASIDVVVVNLYPFEEKAIKGQLPLEEAIEYVDIGGPTLIRSAAKNWEHVAVLTAPSDYEVVVSELRENGAISRDTRRLLASKAFRHTGRYDSLISRTFQRLVENDELPSDQLLVALDCAQVLRYGENPHQKAAVYAFAGGTPDVVGAHQHHGKALSYNNLLDLDAAWSIARSLPKAAAVVVKHTNPCGAAYSSDGLLAAYRRALACDPVSAFGGIAAFNDVVDEDLAVVLTEIFLEIVAAPGFTDGALEQLKKKKNLRVMEMPSTNETAPIIPWMLRSIGGGVLAQELDVEVEDADSWSVVTERAPSESEAQGLRLMWEVCRHVKSNAIICGDSDGTSAIGAGQMSRVDAVQLCAMKAKLDLAGTVAASDAFFPFRDGVDELAKMGVTAIIQPGGSIRDEEVVQACNEHGIAMVCTGHRHFRH